MSPKAELRRAALARRRAMDPAEVENASQAIALELLTSNEFANAHSVYLYVSHQNEVDTRAILAAALRAGKNVFCPRVSTDHLSWGHVESLDALAPGAYGILEPLADAAALDKFSPNDLCVVPGVLFREDGHRLGRGGGHYDRFLATFNGITVGLAYDWQVSNDFAPEPHDVPVQLILTERRALRARAV